MTCVELKDSLSAYVDDCLSAHARSACDAHLDYCPLCRSEVAATRALARRYAALARPAPPAELAAAISHRLRTEGVVMRDARIRKGDARTSSHAWLMNKLMPRVMPASIGAVASVVLFVAVVGALFPAVRTLHVIEQASLLEAGYITGGAGYDVTKPITAEDYVASRAGYTNISPSLDPRGALATSDSATDADLYAEEDDMLVIADVDSDGQATLAGVVTPPRDARMLTDLEAALRRTPAFVPARLDRRPASMRVVFMVQRMNVRDTIY